VRGRSVIEIMVLSFTFVVGAVLLLTATALVVIEVRDPGTDTSSVAQALLSLISGILGALLGLIAGRSASTTSLDRREEDHLQ
jgi:hypothetical protein